MKVAYEYSELVEMIDSTLLKPFVSAEEIEQLCKDATEYGFKAVIVNPVHVKTCKKLLKDTKVKVGTVVGFPLGDDLTKIKLYEIKLAKKEGAEEIDAVMSLSAARAGDWKYIGKEIKKMVKKTKKNSVFKSKKKRVNRIFKVILETSYLSDEEIVKACQVCVEAGADFVKTGTGYAGNATPEHVALMLRAVKNQLSELSNKDDKKYCGVKASAGIRTYEQANALAEAGATRIGTSHAAEIAKEGKKFDRAAKSEAKAREKEAVEREKADDFTEEPVGAAAEKTDE